MNRFIIDLKKYLSKNNHCFKNEPLHISYISARYNFCQEKFVKKFVKKNKKIY